MNGKNGTAARPSYVRVSTFGRTCRVEHETYTYWPIRPDSLVLRILQCPTGIPHDTVDSKSWQPHTRYALENGSLNHYGSKIFNGWHMSNVRSPICGRQWFSSVRRSRRQHPRRAGMLYTLIPQVGFIPFMTHISCKIRPRDAVGSFDEPWMSYWPE